MSGSCVLSLRRLQAAVKTATGVDVPALPMARALLEQMGAGSLRFDRDSLETHERRLRNWQAADSALLSNAPIGGGAHQQQAYASYLEEARAAGLEPMSFNTFKLRVYNLPGLSRVPAE